MRFFSREKKRNPDRYPTGPGFTVKRPIRKEVISPLLHSRLILLLLASRIWRALHESVNFVHDPEKQYKSLSVAHRPGGDLYSCIRVLFFCIQNLHIQCQPLSVSGIYLSRPISRSECRWAGTRPDLSPTVKKEFFEFSCMRAFCL